MEETPRRFRFLPPRLLSLCIIITIPVILIMVQPIRKRIPLLLQTPPDPTRLNPFAQNRINPWGKREDLDGLLRIAAEFGRMGEKQMYEIIRRSAITLNFHIDLSDGWANVTS